jgi:hypothetical protein
MQNNYRVITVVVTLIFCVIYMVYLWKRRFKKAIEFKPRKKNVGNPIDISKYDIGNKIIAIKNGNYDLIVKAIAQFFVIQESKYIVKLSKISEDYFIITFPCDTSFQNFCYLINYLNFPHNLDIGYYPDIKGWVNNLTSEKWINHSSLTEKLMVFIPKENHDETDCVYYTTNRNKGYRINFANRNKIISLKYPLLDYTSSGIRIKEIEKYVSIDIYPD